MENLKISAVLMLIIPLVFGCQSAKSFKMQTFEKEELHIVEVDSNRIIQECYFLNAAQENNWRHQYILNLLNEDNEVIPVFYPTNQGKRECMAHLKKVTNVLKKEPRVRLCVRDKLEKTTADNSAPEFHDFGPLGKHEWSYHALTFDTICNSKECYSINDLWTDTCPGFHKK